MPALDNGIVVTMSDIAIRVENLSKQYRIGGQQAGYKTIRESLTEAVGAPFRRLSSVVRGQSSAVSNETIWALKDVSFQVKPGEVVGIIGRNGAGKTTLLKILSRITEPTEGQAEIHGRVGSLLEVGTGFHPELTGRENIYLNGAILGMKRAEIERKFDEIVAFAEIEKFIDTPVKHYSSGMYVRLAFAVAAHLEPEILLVDEVLAVGDAAFQEKCLRHIRSLKDLGITVLFVSHNLHAVQSLCPRVILLNDGQILLDGPANEVVPHYYRLVIQTTAQLLGDKPRSLKDRASHDKPAWITDVIFIRNGQEVTNRVTTGDRLSVKISYYARQNIELVAFTCGFYGQDGSFRSGYSTTMDSLKIPPIEGAGEVIIDFPEFTLSPGIYEVSVSIADDMGLSAIDWLQRQFILIVEPGVRILGDFYIPTQCIINSKNKRGQ